MLSEDVSPFWVTIASTSHGTPLPISPVPILLIYLTRLSPSLWIISTSFYAMCLLTMSKFKRDKLVSSCSLTSSYQHLRCTHQSDSHHNIRRTILHLQYLLNVSWNEITQGHPFFSEYSGKRPRSYWCSCLNKSVWMNSLQNYWNAPSSRPCIESRESLSTWLHLLILEDA